MASSLLGTLGPLAVVALAALIAAVRPGWTFALLLIAIPLRVPVFTEVELATLILVGAVLGRAPAVVNAIAAQPALFAATLALPAWFLLSGLWARSSGFVVLASAKWLVLWLAMALVIADDTLAPRRIVWAAILAMVPSALWAVAERARLVAPLGDERILRNRAIDLVHMVRGRALFWHPNRLAEFVEQVGLLLVGTGVGGVLPALCAAGAVIAAAGTWGTDSKAGMATMIGGGVLTFAWLHLSTAARRRAIWIGVAGLAVASAVAVWAYVAHGGIGTRVLVYRFAWQIVAEQPLLGIGGGNWPLAVASAPLGVSRFWFRTHAHSLPLQLAVEVGLVGVLLGVLLFAAPLWVAWRALPGASAPWRGVAHGAMAGVLGLLAHNLVHYFLRDAADGIVTGMLLGLAVAAAQRRGDLAPADARA
jgi:hypothetical protein